MQSIDWNDLVKSGKLQSQRNKRKCRPGGNNTVSISVWHGRDKPMRSTDSCCSSWLVVEFLTLKWSVRARVRGFLMITSVRLLVFSLSHSAREIMRRVCICVCASNEMTFVLNILRGSSSWLSLYRSSSQATAGSRSWAVMGNRLN